MGLIPNSGTPEDHWANLQFIYQFIIILGRQMDGILNPLGLLGLLHFSEACSWISTACVEHVHSFAL